jgi:hypothetical protein
MASDVWSESLRILEQIEELATQEGNLIDAEVIDQIWTNRRRREELTELLAATVRQASMRGERMPGETEKLIGGLLETIRRTDCRNMEELERRKDELRAVRHRLGSGRVAVASYRFAGDSIPSYLDRRS